MGGCGPLGLDPPDPTAKPSSWSCRNAGRERAGGDAPSAATSPHHAKHQHQHDHDDQHPQPCRHGSLLGRRRAAQADATAGHQSKQLGHRQATFRAGSTAALRAGSRGPLRWAEPFGPRPAQPSPTRRTRQASTDPTQPQRDHSEPDRRIWQGREEVALLGWGTMRAWPCRCAMADAAPPAPDRRCAPSSEPEPYGVLPDA
jgi:hypothetical protein